MTAKWCMADCVVCGSPLSGRKTRFCTRICKNSFGNNRLQSYRAQQLRGRERKIRLVRSRGSRCETCGYARNFAALEFHHLKPQAKTFNLDLRSLSNRRWSSIVTEAKKCALLCSNSILNSLREAGVQIAIDDFGTGYSSLSYLQELPFDRIKIDKSIVDLIGAGGNSEKICRTIIKMAHELGKESIAEGVENREQADFLQTISATACKVSSTASRWCKRNFTHSSKSRISIRNGERRWKSLARLHETLALAHFDPNFLSKSVHLARIDL